MTKQNKQLIAGILLGILVPIFSSIILKKVLGFFPDFEYFNAVDWMDIIKINSVTSTFIQFGVLINLLVFLVLKWKKQIHMQTGLVILTMLFILLAMLLKFVF